MTELPENVLEVEDLHMIYSGGVHAVRGISFNVNEGESVAILAPLAVENHPFFLSLRHI